MGRGDYVLYRNTERNFEVSILSLIIIFQTTLNYARWVFGFVIICYYFVILYIVGGAVTSWFETCPGLLGCVHGQDT